MADPVADITIATKLFRIYYAKPPKRMSISRVDLASAMKCEPMKARLCGVGVSEENYASVFGQLTGYAVDIDDSLRQEVRFSLPNGALFRVNI